MVVAFVKAHPVFSEKVSDTTASPTLGTTVPAGNLIVLAILFDNAATAGKPVISGVQPPSIQSGQTPGWVFLGAARSTSTSAGAFASGELWAIKTSLDWSATTYVVPIDTAVTMKAAVFLEFSGAEATLRSTVGTAYSTTTTAASATTTGTAPVVGDLALGWLFGSNVAAAQAGDNDTTGGAWSTPIGVGSTGSSAATNNYGVAQYKILTAASHQTYNNSAAMTAGNGAIAAVLRASTPPWAQQDAYQIFADGTETGSTALAGINTDPTIDVSSGDVNLNLRYRIAEYNAVSSPATDDWTVQWQKNSSGTWSDLLGPVVVTDSYEGSADTTVGLTVLGSGEGQSFTGGGGTLQKIEVFAKKVGTPAGDSLIYLNAHTGAFGSTGVGTMPSLASSTARTSTTLTTTSAWEPYVFDGTYTLQSGTRYCFYLRIGSTNTAANQVQLSVDNTSPTHAGTAQSVTDTNVFSANTGQDRLFRVYEKVPQVAVGYASPNLTDGGATTNRLGSSNFIAGKVSEDGTVDNLSLPSGASIELLYAVTLKSADLSDGDYIWFRVLRNGAVLDWYLWAPTVYITKTLPAVSQAAYRWYDEGTESGAAPYAAQDTTVIGDITNGDATGTLRIRLQETNGGTVPATDDWQLQYEKNASGTWVNVSAVSTAAQTYDSPNLTNGAATTNRLTGGTGTFVPGKVSEDALMDDLGLPASGYTELVYALKIKAADLAAGDTLRFRVLRNGAVIDNYAVTPRIDLIKSVTAVTQAAYRFYEDGTESSSTALAGQDTAPTVDTSAGDVNLGLRVRLQETGTVAVPGTDDWALQWEKNTSGTWVDVTGDTALADSYSDSNRNAGGGGTLSDLATANAQSFLGDGRRLIRAGFHLNRDINPDGSISAALFAHAGTFGAGGIPTGTALATSTTTVVAASVSATRGWIYFDFDRTFTLTGQTPYFIAITSTITTTVTIGSITTSGDSTSPTHAGNIATRTSGGTWVAEAKDMMFEVYTGPATAPTTVLIYDSPSLTDAAATTNRLTGGTGTFAAGKVTEDGAVNDLGWAASGHTELLYSLTLKQADLAPTDTLRFRVLRNGAPLNSYAAVPTVAIGAAGPVTRQATVAMSATSTLTTTGTVAAGALSVTAIPQDFTNPDWVMNGGSATSTRLTFAGSLRSAATATSYTLANSRVFWKVGQTATHITSGALHVDADNYVRLGTDGTSITVQTILDANYVTDFTVADNPAKRFFSIRESGGTITFERSATGEAGTWETLTTGAAPAFAISGAPFRFWSTSGSGTSWVESLNQVQAPVVTAAAALTATSSLTVTGTAFRVLTGSVDLAATSTLTVAGVRVVLPAVAMAASSTLTTGAAVEHIVPAAVPMTATSTLTAGAVRAPQAAVAMAASSTLTAGATQFGVTQATAALTAASTLTTGAVPARVAAVPLAAASALTTSAVRFGVTQAAADLTASSTLTTAAVPERPAAAPMTVASTLTVGGTVAGLQPAAAALDAASTLTTGAVRAAPAAAALDAASTLTTGAVRFGVTQAAAAAVAASTLTTGAVPARVAAAALTADSGLTVAATRFGVAQAGVALAATSTLTVTALGQVTAAAALTAAASLTTAAVRVAPAAAAMTSASSLTTAAIRTQPAAAALTAASTLTAAASTLGQVTAAAALLTTATLTVGAAAARLAAVPMVTTAALTVAAVRDRPAAAALTVASTLTTGAVRSGAAVVDMAAATTLTVGAVVARVSGVPMAAVAVLTVGAVGQQPVAVGLTVIASLTTVGLRTVSVTVTLAASSSLAVGAVRGRPAAVTMTVSSTLAAGGLRLAPAGVALTAVAALSVAAIKSGVGLSTVAGAPVRVKLSPSLWAPVGKVLRSTT